MYLGATLGAAAMGRALDLGGFTAAGLLAASVVAAGALIAALGVRERLRPPVVPAGQPIPGEP
jgi:predicted MFS family arabinose efflux permease